MEDLLGADIRLQKLLIKASDPYTWRPPAFPVLPTTVTVLLHSTSRLPGDPALVSEPSAVCHTIAYSTRTCKFIRPIKASQSSSVSDSPSLGTWTREAGTKLDLAQAGRLPLRAYMSDASKHRLRPKGRTWLYARVRVCVRACVFLCHRVVRIVDME